MCGGAFRASVGPPATVASAATRRTSAGRTICANRQTVKIAALEDAVLGTVRTRLAAAMPEVLAIATEEYPGVGGATAPQPAR